MSKQPEIPTFELIPSDRNTLKAMGVALDELAQEMEHIGVRYPTNDSKDPVLYVCADGNKVLDDIQSRLEALRADIRTVVEESIDFGDAALHPI